MKNVKEGYNKTNIGEIPNDWIVDKLGDKAYIKARIGWRGLSSDEYTDEGPYLVAGKHIKGSKILWDECDHISIERYNESSEIMLKEKDIIMTKDGTIGRVGFIDKLNDKATINGTMMLIRPDEELFYSKFLYYYFQGENFKKVINEKVSGSSIPHIFQRDMVNLEVPIPHKYEQEKIILILSTLDEQIDITDALIEKNKRLKKGLMKTLLTKGIGNIRFRKTDIGEIPEEWDYGKLSNYVELKHGYQFRKEDFIDCGIPIIKISQISMNGKLELKELTYISNSRENDFKDIIIKNGDILLALSGATVGKVALVKDLNGVYLQNYRVGKLICNNNLVNEYVFHYINSEIFYKQLMKLTNTSAQPNFGKQDMDKILITIPPKKEQQKIASKLSKVDEKIDMYENKKQRLEKLKRGLIQQLLTGSIRVI